MAEYEYRKLRGRIIEKFGTMAAFAREVGTTTVTLANKMNGHTQISQKDIEKWSKPLEIPLEEYGDFYFS